MRLPKLGFGTYLQHSDQRTLVKTAIDSGCMLIDSAPNYNSGSAHREIAIGIEQSQKSKDEILISTKIGYAATNNEFEHLISTLKLRKDEFIGNHSLSSVFLEYQIRQNLLTLGLKKIPILFLHNPDIHLERISSESFNKRIRNAFEVLESAVSRSQIESYGISTWSGFGLKGDNPKFRVEELITIAEDVAGPSHHFKYIQMPINLVYYESLFDAFFKKSGPICDAKELGISIFASSPLFKGELLKLFDSAFTDLTGTQSIVQSCLRLLEYFDEIDTILIGGSNISQIQENFKGSLNPVKLPDETVELILSSISKNHA